MTVSTRGQTVEPPDGENNIVPVMIKFLILVAYAIFIKNFNAVSDKLCFI